MFVLDASVTLAWCFEDEANELADRVIDRLLTEEALTSPIWSLEVANALRMAERRGRMDPVEVPRIRQLLSALPIRTVSIGIGDALAGVSELARTLELSSYDASYLSVSVDHHMPLATVDERLAAAATRVGVELIS